MFSPTYLQNITETTEALASQAKGSDDTPLIAKEGKGAGVVGLDESTPQSTQPSFFKPNPKNYAFEGRMVGASLGILGAVGYAFKTKSGFLKGLGYWVLGGLVLGGVGYGVGLVIKKKKKNGEG
jgi:hypothetical protein